jgi:hypothetical protein
MTKPTRLRIAGLHMDRIRAHLYPGDDKEAVAFALCGRHSTRAFDVLLVQDVHLIPYGECAVRAADRVTWKTDGLEPLLLRAAAEGLGVVKFHSHPTGYEEFSVTDDQSDRDLFQSVYGWVDDRGPHASVIMLPDSRLLGRAVSVDNRFEELDQIAVAANDIVVSHRGAGRRVAEHAERHAQLFGPRTVQVLQNLSVGIVGCSGTGGLVVEMLARLGVGRLVLVDPDRVEYRNLNRIVGTTAVDAALGRLKVEAVAQHVAQLGLGTQVQPVAREIATAEAVRALASCDILFGCVDSHDGRRTLGRLANFYVLPYFDCGVGIAADGDGGVEEVSIASHYVQPGRSTLLGRGVIHAERANAEAMARRDPVRYRELRAEKYIANAEVNSPAVISVNALAASLSVNELLARLHPFRVATNAEHASVRLNLTGMYLDNEREGDEAPLARSLGRGDVEPLLDLPDISETSST